jgi:tungstate transport system substrate-binding protein
MDPYPSQPPTNLSYGGLRRRDLGRFAAGAVAAAALPAAVATTPGTLAAAPAAAEPATAPAHHPDTVRLGTVPAAATGGLLNQLVAGFQAQHPYQVVITTGNAADLYAQAGSGELDLVLSHLGLTELADFVGRRAGRWPQLVLATSFAYLAAADDPAGIRDATDAVDAFDRIATSQSPFVVNNLGNVRFVIDTLWHAAGEPDQTGWWVDNGLSGPAAAQAAEQLGGYTLWGVHPFLAFEQQQGTSLQAVLSSDSLLQRVVASVVVRPSWTRRVNLPGALALEQFLLAPQTQGTIRRFRHPRFALPLFWPAAHHNAHE